MKFVRSLVVDLVLSTDMKVSNRHTLRPIGVDRGLWRPCCPAKLSDIAVCCLPPHNKRCGQRCATERLSRQDCIQVR
jgi:hypothetical protein